MKNRILTLVLLFVTLFATQSMQAQAPVDSPEQAITGLLNRIGGNGAASLFEIVIDANLAENGKDVFVITTQNGKPCIKGNTQLSVATGINWYLNHVAHINLTWNNLTTDLSKIELPLPQGEDKHVCNTTYRYDFNTCTFSYSMAFWTWERWQQEIDWMALHGINAPLNLVGLDVVTRKFLRELGVSENDINAYIAGPGFIAWFAMNNLEGWGGTINANDVTMNGNPDWWYTRQEQLCRDMLQRMRELGMQPVIPGFSGQVPNCIVNYTINGFNSGDVVNNGTWAGGYTRPDILKPNTESYRTFAAVYYKHLYEVMGVSEFYSIDPFHEGSLPSGVSNETCYPNIMVELDKYYNGVSQEDKAKNNVDEAPKWIIQYWQGVPQSGAFSAMSSYGDRFIGLDLFSDAPGKAKWNTDYFQGRPYIFCMLHNFGGRSGLHGRLESTMNDYFRALAKGNNMQGIGATPEGTETNPILYDMLFELPWMNPATRPTADEWLQDYAYARYGVENSKALSALKYLKKSVWACPTDQQGTSEAVILARPNWTVGSVSSWSTSAIYWDTQDVLLAADELSSITDLNTEDGIANYNYDFIDVTRQAMVDYAAELLPLINASRNNNAEYTRLYQLYLQLMLDLDKMLSYDENFKLERWTSLARNITNEVAGTTENDRRWLEWNARTQITVWSKGDTDLHDYSNRCWAGLIKDYHYKRWKQFFESNGNAFSGGWYSGFEYPWTVDFTNYNYSTVTIPDDMTATEKAKETFGNYFGRVKGKDKNYIFPMGITRDATKSGVITEVYRGQEVELPLETGKNVTISSVWIDLNNDGAASNNEALTANGNKVTIPADAVIGQTKAKVTYSDGTVITFNIALIEDITDARTVTAASADNGSVAIEGTNELTVTTTEAVKITATANTGYNFNNWTNTAGEVVSNNNPFIYYGKEDAAFTANFIQDKWGVVACNGSFSGDIAGYSQFIHNLTFAYYNREPETIFEATTAPTEIFNTIPQIINVPQGASFDVKYNNGGSNGLKYCYFRAFIDLNADGDFDDEGELLKEVGTNGAENATVCSNKINVLLPYDTPLGITHMRLRFDGAWDNSNNPSGRGAKDASIRPVYEIIINVTDKSDKAATINVETNNQEWGTVEVWTDETPDGSTGTEWNVTKGVQFYLRATKASEDAEFLGWYDQYGRLLTTELEHTMYAREDATYTARFRKFLEIDGWQMEYRTDKRRANRIVLTKVRESGKNDLVIPETVEILGEPYSIVGFDNNLFKNNKELWSITLPKSIEFVSNNTLYSCFVEGNVASTTGKYESGNNNFIVKELGDNKVSSSNGWIIEIDGKTDGSTFNQWGSALIATGETPMHVGTSSFPNGFQIYLGKSGNVVAKINDETENAINGVTVSGNFKATIEYDKTNVTITITCNEQTSSFTKAAQMNDIEKLSFAIPQGIELDINIKETEEPDPFEGCSNLIEIAIDEDCANYYVEDGALYKSNNTDDTEGTLLHEPEGKDKAEAIRTLGELINATKALIAEVATTVNPTGKATEVALNATQGNDYYIWCNNPHTSGNDGAGGVAALLDEDEGTYLHSNWSSLSSTHDYLQIDFGNAVGLDNFKIAGQQRKDGQNDRPKNIEIYGSNDNSTWTHITTVEGLPNTTGATWESGAISVKTRYSHLKFIVKTHDNYNQTSPVNRPYFHMAKFDLFKVTSTAEVAAQYANLVGITAAEVENVYDKLTETLYYYNNSGTAEELQAAHDALKPSYDTLNAKKEKILNGVYNINYKNNPIFVAYTNAFDGLTGASAGYRLVNPNTDNTTNNTYLEIQNNAINAKVATDALFTIVPNSESTGYTISAQGLFLHSTRNEGWAPQLLSNDETKAGIYLFEETTVNDITTFKIKSNRNDIQYINDWGPVFGNDKSSKANLSTFTLTQVTEYTLTVPEGDITTLCLPFNVVLPEGVTAYDITKSDIASTFYDMSLMATTGDILAKNTPAIIKAAAGTYHLAITMSDEGVKSAMNGSILRGTCIKSSINEGNNYKLTSSDATFRLATNSTEAVANSCWIALDTNPGATITRLPFTLTKDEENPALYKIVIKRADDNSKVLGYEYNDGKIAVDDAVNNSSWQAWYMTNCTNGITIHPYNAEGKVIGVNDTGNGAGKVTAATKGINAYDEWTLVELSNGYYNIKIHNGNNYLSHNGGGSNKMGLWDGNPTGDGGTQFKFIDAEFENNNPNYFQLNDVKSEMPTIYYGESIGLYKNNTEEHRNAIVVSEEIITAGSTSDRVACHNAYKTLLTARKNLPYNAPDTTKFYVIKSTASNEYCRGKYVHTYCEPHVHENATWGDKKYDQHHLLFDAEGDIEQLPLAVFQFEETGCIGEYKIKNLHTGLYVKSFEKNAEHMGAEAEAQKVKISGVTDGQVKLQIGNNSPMHAQQDYSVIVSWGAEANNASTWCIEKVEGISHSITLTDLEYATLYLNYPVEIPSGINAYRASEIVEDSWIHMEEVTGVIPAQTAVVLHGKAGSYALKYTVSDAEQPTNLLKGTLWKQVVSKDGEDSMYYILANHTDKGVGMYTPTNGENVDEFINQANKAYLSYEQPAAPIAAFSFRGIIGGGTTEIEDVESENEEAKAIYDLQGRKLNTITEPGLYIINGNKILVK